MDKPEIKSLVLVSTVYSFTWPAWETRDQTIGFGIHSELFYLASMDKPEIKPLVLVSTVYSLTWQVWDQIIGFGIHSVLFYLASTGNHRSNHWFWHPQ
jgi:hypothetical protein